MNSIHFGAIVKFSPQDPTYLLTLSASAGVGEKPYRIKIAKATSEDQLAQLKSGTFGKAYGDWRITMEGEVFTIRHWQPYPYTKWDPKLQNLYRNYNKDRIKAWKTIIERAKDFFQPITVQGHHFSAKESYEKALGVLNTLKNYESHAPMYVYHYFQDINLDITGLYWSSLNQPLIKSFDSTLTWTEISNQLAIIKNANEVIFKEIFCQLSDKAMI